MIAAATDRKRSERREASGEKRRRPRPQVVEVRVVVEVQMPHWMHPGGPLGNSTQAGTVSAVLPPRVDVSQRPPSADPLRGESQEGKSVPDQDVNGSAFFVTSTPAQAEIVQTTTSEESASDDPATLLEVYESKMMAKRARSAGKKGIAEHRSSCRSFDLFCQDKKHLRFSTPKVFFQKHGDLMQSYAAWSIVEKDLSRDTTDKRIGHILMVARDVYQIKLDRPTEKELKKLEDSKPKKDEDGRRIPSFDEVNALATAVTVSRWPYRAHAPYFWRGLIRFAAFIGFRTYDVVSLIPEKTGLRKSDVIWDTLCPIADVNNALGYELHSPFGWLHYEVKKDTHSDCGRILVPMPAWLRDWVRFFFELSGHPERIFPSMNQDALDSKSFGQTWQKIIKQAGVDPRIKISEGSGNVIAIRKYAANWWTLAALRSKTHAALADKISQYVLHHTEVTTATRHYLSTQAAVLPVMLELMKEWPVPAAEATHVSLLPE